MTHAEIAARLRHLADQFEDMAASLSKIDDKHGASGTLPMLRATFPPDENGDVLALVCGAEYVLPED